MDRLTKCLQVLDQFLSTTGNRLLPEDIQKQFSMPSGMNLQEQRNFIRTMERNARTRLEGELQAHIDLINEASAPAVAFA